MRRIPALDGLRGVAILLVISEHYWNFPRGGGAAGVGLFFVLSGYLITSILLGEHEREGRIDLRGFYVRRVRRLVPALVVMLGAYLAGAAVQGHLHRAVVATLTGGLYTGNVTLAWRPDLLMGEPIRPLWSLALEEQFYLLWPAMLIGLLAFRSSRRWAGAGCALVMAAVCVERAWMTFVQHGEKGTTMFAAPHMSVDQLMAGVTLAFVARKPRILDQRLCVLAVFVFAVFAITRSMPAAQTPVVDVCGAVIVWFAVQPRSWIGRWLAWRPLVWVGLVSYSLYLWHLLILAWVGYRPVALAVSVAAAAASWRLVEQRFRARRTGRRTALRGSRRAGRSLPRSLPQQSAS